MVPIPATGIEDFPPDPQALEEDEKAAQALEDDEKAAEQNEMIAKTGEKIWCEDCEMELNGPTQWEDHKNGKKHIKNVKKRKGTSSSARPQLLDMPESKTVETAPQAPRPPPQQATEQTDPPASPTWQPSPQCYVMPQWHPQGFSPHDEYWLAWHTQWAAGYDS